VGEAPVGLDFPDRRDEGHQDDYLLDILAYPDDPHELFD
jgi:hypothetical protein